MKISKCALRYALTHSIKMLGGANCCGAARSKTSRFGVKTIEK